MSEIKFDGFDYLKTDPNLEAADGIEVRIGFQIVKAKGLIERPKPKPVYKPDNE